MFALMTRRPPRPTRFPYTTLFRSSATSAASRASRSSSSSGAGVRRRATGASSTASCGTRCRYLRGRDQQVDEVLLLDTLGVGRGLLSGAHLVDRGPQVRPPDQAHQVVAQDLDGLVDDPERLALGELGSD